MSETKTKPTRTLAEQMAAAQACWQAGDVTGAVAQCRLVLARWPGQGDAAHLLGLVAHGQGHLAEALDAFRAAAAAPGAPALYAANLAEICRLHGLLAEGEAAARRAVTAAPHMAGAWNNLGIIWQEQGRYEQSRDALGRALALQPDNAETCNNLANTCKRLGLTAEAARLWRRALTLRPDYAQPLSNLCNLLGEEGAFEAALAAGRQAIALNPRLADAYVNLAGVETARNAPEAALGWLRALLGFAPGHALGLAALALVLKKLERLPEALTAAERAVAIAPQNAEAQNARASVLHALGQPEAALAGYERAATLPGTAAEQALVSRAVLLMEQGDTEAAHAAFARALARFPRSITALFNRADLIRFTADDPDIARMEALLAEPGTLTGNDRMMLNFALGKAYLDTGDSPRAFAQLATGNAAKRASFAYAPEMATRLVDATIATFTPALLTRLAGAGADSGQPVFVVGMPRSGTTLVEQILASHPAVQGAGELTHLQALASSIAGYPQGAAALTPEACQLLGDAYLARLAPLANGAAHVVDKMPANFAHAGLIRLILPQARIIHCRRDSVDTCLSCYTKLFSGEQLFAYDQRELGLFHNDYERLMAHWRGVLPASHFLEVRYEDVVEDLETQARRMLSFLGLPWDPACLDFHRTARTVRTASVNQVRQPLYKSSAGRWRKHEAQLGPLLAALGRG